MAKKTSRPGRTLMTFFMSVAVLYGLAALGGTWKPQLGLDLEGGTRITLQAISDVNATKLEQARGIIEQRANDYDLVSLWVADETTGPVQLHDRLPVSVRNGTIDSFWLEFNTSTTELGPNRTGDLTAYVRNIVALVDPAEVKSVLVRPVSARTP